MKPLAHIVCIAAFAGATPALADVDIGVNLSVTGDSEVKVVKYDCEGRDPLTVTYLNASPNFLALMPIDGQTMIFVNTLSASGAKYQAGQYVWWNKGSDATLSDVTEGLDAAPVLTCSEEIDTP